MQQQLAVGTRVEAGMPGTDDFDSGRVVTLSENSALVAWSSGVMTWSPIADLQEVKRGR